MQPLAGMTVVALEQAVAAPFATRQLADLGARVIKIERPETGDFARHYDDTVRGMASHFVWLNRSKESMTLNLKSPEAIPVLRGLLAKADVFVQNLLPGATDRLGIGTEVLRQTYPSLICCNISGFGDNGPYSRNKAYDLLVQAESGLLTVTGTPDSPAKVGISVADIAAGMYAYSGILTALLARHQTGTGTVVEISMLEALGEWMGYPLYFSHYGGSAPARSGAHHAAIAPYGPYATGDGTEVYLGIQNDREWVRFCEEVLDRPQWVHDPRFSSNSSRVAHRDSLDREILAIFGHLPKQELLERLDRAQIAHADLNTMEQFWHHPQLAQRNRWRTVQSPVGPLEALLPPATLVRAEPRMDPIPDIGQHTEMILKELGYSEQEISDLHRASVI